MQKIFLLAGSLFGGLGIAIGAFGAHALKKMLEESGRFETFETAVKYQFYHAFALLILGLLMFKLDDNLFKYAGWSFIVGTLIFSGSLYILCLSNVGKWGAVTPIGGLVLIAGWIVLFYALLKNL